MRYKLIAYRYNDLGVQMAKFEQSFSKLHIATNKVYDIMATFSNYEIYLDGKVFRSNFKRSK